MFNFSFFLVLGLFILCCVLYFPILNVTITWVFLTLSWSVLLYSSLCFSSFQTLGTKILSLSVEKSVLVEEVFTLSIRHMEVQSLQYWLGLRSVCKLKFVLYLLWVNCFSPSKFENSSFQLSKSRILIFFSKIFNFQKHPPSFNQGPVAKRENCRSVYIWSEATNGVLIPGWSDRLGVVLLLCQLRV